MSITNYSELQTAVGRWLQRTDLSLLLPDFISLAEAEFNRTLRLSGQIVRADLSCSDRWTALNTLTAPLAEIRSASITASGARHELQYLAPDKTQRYYEATTGSPLYYTRVGDELGLFPPPSSAVTVELIYWRTIPDLASNSTNFLLTLAPDLYLYRSVLEGAHYVHAPQIVARVEPMYQRALAQVQADDQRRAFGGTSLQIRVA